MIKNIDDLKHIFGIKPKSDWDKSIDKLRDMLGMDNSPDYEDNGDMEQEVTNSGDMCNQMHKKQ